MNSLLKSPEEIEIIRKGGAILAKILKDTAGLVKPGISTWELNQFAEAQMAKISGRPSFKNYGPKGHEFPAGLCTSINSVVVHGIPSKKDILKEGDIIGLDIGMEYKGFYTDTAITVPVGKVSTEAKRLLETAKRALHAGIDVAKPGNRIGDIGFAVQNVVESAGFGVVRDMVGHGVGYSVHEDPQVPNYGRKGTGLILKEGMVLAIEPMVTVGDWHIAIEDDGWTVTTLDYSLAAQFEHTVAITKDGAEILTD